MEFLVDNYAIFLIIAILLLMALIGYYAQKADILNKKTKAKEDEGNQGLYSAEHYKFDSPSESVYNSTLDISSMQEPIRDNQTLNEEVAVQTLFNENISETLNEPVESLPIIEPEMNPQQPISNEPVEKMVEENDDLDSSKTNEAFIDLSQLLAKEETPIIAENSTKEEISMPVDSEFTGLVKDEPMDHEKVKEYLNDITKDIDKIERNQTKLADSLKTSESNSKSFEEIMNNLESEDNVEEILDKSKNKSAVNSHLDYSSLDEEFNLPKINLPKYISDDEIWN